MNDITRCPWSDLDDLLIKDYHDHEWGKLNLDERYLFEMLVLELFQSGLSWSTVLHKRQNFRQAFCNFVPEEVAQMTEQDKARLLQDKGIIRNQRKLLLRLPMHAHC